MSRLNRLDSSLNLYAAPLVAPDVIRDNTPRPAIMEIHADTEIVFHLGLASKMRICSIHTINSVTTVE